jgi:hypothetical protein
MGTGRPPLTPQPAPLVHRTLATDPHPLVVLLSRYNCTVVGQGGGGGEYTPQQGFGWTNGAALDLLRVFGPSLPNLEP